MKLNILLAILFVGTIVVAGMIDYRAKVDSCEIPPHKVKELARMDYRVKCNERGWVYQCKQGIVTFESTFAVVTDKDLCDWKIPARYDWELVNEWTFPE